jgi:hypothetical protein
MVNASLNWASIVGIVLAVGGTMLYFLRTFKPGLARDYDVFFAAVGLLCGGILFFQGWRLDPILQFGQFLLAATTVFFAYESVRLRSVTTEQARRSAYFDDDEPLPSKPRMGRGEWSSEDRFDDPQPLRRRIRSRGDEEFDDAAEEEDFYRPSRPERRAIPERAQSRFSGRGSENEERSERRVPSERGRASRYSSPTEPRPEFGARRRARDARPARAGSRPVATADDMPRSSRRPGAGERPSSERPSTRPEPGSAMPKGAPISDADFSPVSGRSGVAAPVQSRPAPDRSAPESRAVNPDNSSRFDD